MIHEQPLVVAQNAAAMQAAGAHVFPVALTIGEDGKKRAQFPPSWEAYTAGPSTLAEVASSRGYGIDCGRSGFVVVDLDRKADVDGVALWSERGLSRSPFVVRTQAGGEHHYFRAPRPEDGVVANGSLPTLGVDVRGAGGLVYGPGTRVEGGGIYEIAAGSTWTGQIADLPPAPLAELDALREEDRANKRARAAVRRPTAFIRPPGHASRVEQCEHRVREHLALLEASVAGGFNDQLNTLCFVVGQLFAEREAAELDGDHSAEAAREYVRELMSESDVMAPADDADETTINSTGIERGMSEPYEPSGPSELELAMAARMFPPAPADAPEFVDVRTYVDAGPVLLDVAPAPAVPAQSVDVTNVAAASEWLQTNIGRGHLAGMFRRGHELVFSPREGEHGYVPAEGLDEDGPAQVRRLDAPQLRARVQFAPITWYKTAKGGEVSAAMFPPDAARVVADAPDQCPNLRPLRGVTHTPVMRADGTVLDRPGYDPDTGLLFLPTGGLVVPAIADLPGPADVAAAVGLLGEMLAGFPFVTPADRANFLGLLLTPLIREVAPGPYKLGVISAPQPGSGKSLLAAVLRTVHGGVFRSEMPEDGAELRKQVTSILDATTGPVVTFDNVTGILRSSVLAGLLTSGVWDDRRLGGNEVLQLTNDRLWTLTGNNAHIGGDLARRTLWVTIDPGIPNPEKRNGFAIPDLERWVQRNRGRVLHALLTLARAWAVAGKPTQRKSSDTYGQWAAVVAGILEHAGVPGGFDAPESVQQAVGDEDDEWRTFLEAVHRVFGDGTWTVKDLLAQVDTTDSRFALMTGPGKPIKLDELPDQLAERVASSPTGGSRTVGRWLLHREGRWAGQHAARKVGTTQGVAVWQVRTQGDQTGQAA